MHYTAPLHAACLGLIALTGFGCSGETPTGPSELPTPTPGEFSDGDSEFKVGSVKIGEDEIAFLDIGGGVGVAQTTSGFSYYEMMQKQGGTPLELYLTFSNAEETDVPAQLVADHYAKTKRSPQKLDTTELDEARAARATGTITTINCSTLNLHNSALLRFAGSGDCHTDLTGLEGLSEGHQVDTDDVHVTAADRVLTTGKDNYYYGTCVETGTIQNQLWFFDTVFGWAMFWQASTSTNQWMEFNYAGDAVRELIFVTFTTLIDPPRYNLESLEKCQ